MPIPKPAEFSRVDIVWQKAPDKPFPPPGDGETHPITLRVKNRGPSDAFLLRIGQEPGPIQSIDNRLPTFTFSPPEVIVKLAEGEEKELIGQVSYAALRNEPSDTESTLRLKLIQAHGDSVDLEIPVLGRAPENFWFPRSSVGTHKLSPVAQLYIPTLEHENEKSHQLSRSVSCS